MARVNRPPRPSLAGNRTPIKIRKREPFASHDSFLDRLRSETTAGILLLIAVAIALTWANSPWKDSYTALSQSYVGPESLGLNMSVAHWAADGVLVIFFFVVGLELKSEFVTGSLRNVKAAMLPILAAVCGMAVPAMIYVGVQVLGDGRMDGWAIPTATDIAFALALLGLFGKGLPPGLRVFLMTLAVMDDLMAIIVIAVFYSSGLDIIALLASFAAVAAFGVLTQRRITAWWILVPIAIVAWIFMYRSGVHATIAGVLLGMVVPAKLRKGEHHSLTHSFAHALTPLSNGFALPVFAFFSAGITISGGLEMLADPVPLGVMLGLVLGKVIGVWGGVALMTRFSPLKLTGGVDLVDILCASFLAGIGFTVSLLIAELSFPGEEIGAAARLAVVAASAISAVLAAVALRMRVRTAVRGAGARH